MNKEEAEKIIEEKGMQVYEVVFGIVGTDEIQSTIIAGQFYDVIVGFAYLMLEKEGVHIRIHQVVETTLPEDATPETDYEITERGLEEEDASLVRSKAN